MLETLGSLKVFLFCFFFRAWKHIVFVLGIKQCKKPSLYIIIFPPLNKLGSPSLSFVSWPSKQIMETLRNNEVLLKHLRDSTNPSTLKLALLAQQDASDSFDTFIPVILNDNLKHEVKLDGQKPRRYRD